MIVMEQGLSSFKLVFWDSQLFSLGAMGTGHAAKSLGVSVGCGECIHAAGITCPVGPEPGFPIAHCHKQHRQVPSNVLRLQQLYIINPMSRLLGRRGPDTYSVLHPLLHSLLSVKRSVTFLSKLPPIIKDDGGTGGCQHYTLSSL